MDRVRKITGLEQYMRETKMPCTGKNIGVAILDTGLCDQNPDIGYRVSGFRDFINQRQDCYDDNGHGSHIAGIIGGKGINSKGKYRGIAPDCHFVIGKVLDASGNGNVAQVKNAIDWIVEQKQNLGIRILNISVGMYQDVKEQEKCQIIEAVEYAWDAGIVVVVAAGNNGPGEMSVTYPGISPKVITVGAIQENNQKHYSGRGPTEACVMKPEILAPGHKVMSCKHVPYGYVVKSGSSMATPVVSGAIALLLEKKPYLSPIDVKISLYKSARDLGLPKKRQGWGMIDIRKMLKSG